MFTNLSQRIKQFQKTARTSTGDADLNKQVAQLSNTLIELNQIISDEKTNLVSTQNKFNTLHPPLIEKILCFSITSLNSSVSNDSIREDFKKVETSQKNAPPAISIQSAHYIEKVCALEKSQYELEALRKNLKDNLFSISLFKKWSLLRTINRLLNRIGDSLCVIQKNPWYHGLSSIDDAVAYTKADLPKAFNGLTSSDYEIKAVLNQCDDLYLPPQSKGDCAGFVSDWARNIHKQGQNTEPKTNFKLQSTPTTHFHQFHQNSALITKFEHPAVLSGKYSADNIESTVNSIITTNKKYKNQAIQLGTMSLFPFSGHAMGSYYSNQDRQKSYFEFFDPNIGKIRFFNKEAYKTFLVWLLTEIYPEDKFYSLKLMLPCKKSQYFSKPGAVFLYIGYSASFLGCITYVPGCWFALFMTLLLLVLMSCGINKISPNIHFHKIKHTVSTVNLLSMATVYFVLPFLLPYSIIPTITLATILTLSALTIVIILGCYLRTYITPASSSKEDTSAFSDNLNLGKRSLELKQNVQQQQDAIPNVVLDGDQSRLIAPVSKMSWQV